MSRHLSANSLQASAKASKKLNRCSKQMKTSITMTLSLKKLSEDAYNISTYIDYFDWAATLRSAEINVFWILRIFYANWNNPLREIDLLNQLLHSGPENLKKSRPKKLMKSNKSSSRFFFDQIPFFAISKMAKKQFLNWEKV